MKHAYVAPVLAWLVTSSAWPALAQSGATAHRPKIEALTMRLFYETSGTLSRDILGKPPFAMHNATIGEGDALEPASDILVSVTLSIPANEGNSELPLSIRVTNADGKVIGQRIIRGAYFKKNGRAIKTLWLNDAVCAGNVTVEASVGASKVSRKVALNCGE